MINDRKVLTDNQKKEIAKIELQWKQELIDKLQGKVIIKKNKAIKEAIDDKYILQIEEIIGEKIKKIIKKEKRKK